jgi:hypothetical protein
MAPMIRSLTARGDRPELAQVVNTKNRAEESSLRGNFSGDPPCIYSQIALNCMKIVTYFQKLLQHMGQ